ncbi:MAG: NADPH-dependent glutamate synthase, partial [Dehalococcoidales bacterium]|nr:NADPH-dependent glutamate synthase [Dehalococcoidales bacterium]
MELNLNRTEMPCQDPQVRSNNFDEVALGYTEEMAMTEANRCIQCPKRPCTTGCPVGVDIPDFIKALREGRMEEAVTILKKKNSRPGICGRVCPQESQCEGNCVLGKRGAPVAIGRLERYVADWANKNISTTPYIEPASNAKKVAIVGGGPAGLTTAADIAKAGHKVTIFEALHKAGGVLSYGIPDFRLPKNIVDKEVEEIKKMGVEINLDWVIGNTLSVDELFEQGYSAVFLGSGAGLPMFMNIPGENFGGIYSANEILTRISLMHAAIPGYDTPLSLGKNVVVIGAGNVAMDAARSSLRLGSKVTIMYRRTKAEAPARREELEHALEEGITFMELTNPVRFLGDGRGWVSGMECIKMQLGEPDEKGRRRPVEIPNSEFFFEADTVIVSLGTN